MLSIAFSTPSFNSLRAAIVTADVGARPNVSMNRSIVFLAMGCPPVRSAP
jgi:hypothetical protein